MNPASISTLVCEPSAVNVWRRSLCCEPCFVIPLKFIFICHVEYVHLRIERLKECLTDILCAKYLKSEQDDCARDKVFASLSAYARASSQPSSS